MSSRVVGALFEGLCRGLTILTALALVGILAMIVGNGASVISWEFLSAAPSDGMAHGGIFPAIFGTVCITLLMILMALPLGVRPSRPNQRPPARTGRHAYRYDSNDTIRWAMAGRPARG